MRGEGKRRVQQKMRGEIEKKIEARDATLLSRLVGRTAKANIGSKSIRLVSTEISQKRLKPERALRLGA
jgi:hypothetical protein